MSARRWTEGSAIAAHGCMSVIAPLAIPLGVARLSDASPLPLSVLSLCAITLWMKLISYAACNQDYRCDQREAPLCRLLCPGPVSCVIVDVAVQ